MTVFFDIRISAGKPRQPVTGWLLHVESSRLVTGGFSSVSECSQPYLIVRSDIMSTVTKEFLDFATAAASTQYGVEHLRLNPSGTYTSVYDTSSTVYKHAVFSKAASVQNRPAFGGDVSSYFHFGTKTSVSGPYEDVEGHFKDRNLVLTPNFKERCEKGEMIVNNYHNYSMKAAISPPLGVPKVSKLASINPYTSSVTAWDLSRKSRELFRALYPGIITHRGYWYFPPEDAKGPFRIDYGRTPWIDYVKHVYQDVKPLSEIGVDTGFANGVCASLVDLATSEQNIDHSMVQRCLADANDGTLDALTSIAELPDTIQSIIDGFRQLGKITREAKKGEIGILRTKKQKTLELAQSSYRKHLANLVSKIPPYDKWKKFKSSRGLSVQDYNSWVARKKRNFESFEAFELRTRRKHTLLALKQVTDEVTGLWLNYRYNISTTVYMLEDLGETVLAMRNELKFYRWRDGYTTEISVPGFVGKWTRKDRCFIKRSFELESKLDQLGRLLMADVLVTGYELVPLWSIIADWFVSVGPMLRAIRFIVPEKQQVATYSWKHEISGTYTTLSPTGLPVEVRVEAQLYRRIIITPSMSLGLYWSPDVNILRQLDAVSFLWNKLKNPAKQRIYNLR